MIEKCAYCQEVHETGKGLLTDGIPLKECPYVHPHQPFFFNPKEWLRYGDSEYFHRNDSILREAKDEQL